MNEIKRLIQELAAKKTPAVFTATVRSIEGYLVRVDAEGLTYYARLCVFNDTSKKPLLIKPKIGSSVLVCDPAGDRRAFYIVSYCEVDEIIHGKGDHTTARGDEVKRCLDRINIHLMQLWTAVNGIAGSFTQATAKAAAEAVVASAQSTAGNILPTTSIECTKIKIE